MNYNWPGNVRELKNMVDYIAIQKNKRIIDVEDLPYDVRSSLPMEHSLSSTETASILGQLDTLCGLTTVRELLSIFKRNATIIGKIGRKQNANRVRKSRHYIKRWKNTNDNRPPGGI